MLGGEKKGNRENYEENGNAHVSERKRENMWKKDKRWKGVKYIESKKECRLEEIRKEDKHENRRKDKKRSM